MGIHFIVNGRPAELTESVMLAEYLAKLKIDTDYVAIALNGTVVKRDAIKSTYLKDGDRVEIVHPVGGG
jgi:thiamine biosynthesis protein ThiS